MKNLLISLLLLLLGVALISKIISKDVNLSHFSRIAQESNATQIADENNDLEEDSLTQRLKTISEAFQVTPLIKISPEKAIEIAQTVQAGPVQEVELENVDGSIIYEVTIGKTEIIIDPGTGDVLYPPVGPNLVGV